MGEIGSSNVISRRKKPNSQLGNWFFYRMKLFLEIEILQG